MQDQLVEFIHQNEASIRLGVFLAGFVLLALWESASPKRKLSQAKLKRWLINLALLVSSTIVVRVLLPVAVIGLAYLVEQERLGLLNYIDFPIGVELLVSFIILDLSIYFQHAMFHVLPMLWRFHRVHHSDMDCDISTGVRFHPFEIVISALFKFALIIALGAPVLSVILFEVVLNLMSMFTHSNIHLNRQLERVMRWFIVTPDMHRVHHSSLENETNSNFAFNISLWDRIFSTYRAQPEGGHQGMTIGLDQFREPAWQSFGGLIRLPFATGVRGYAINYRDTKNADELASVQQLVAAQVQIFQQAKDSAEQKSLQLEETVLRLTESENYQRTLLENMLDGFISTDEKGVILSFNPAAEKIFGYPAGEIIGQNVSRLMPTHEAKHHDAHLTRYLEKSQSHVIGISREIQGMRKDGSTFPIDIALNDIEYQGKLTFTAVVRDISDRIRNQQQLTTQKEQLANILNNTSDAYLTLDRNWIIHYANPVTESILDINPEQVTGQDLRVALPDVVSMFYKTLRKTLTTQTAQEKTCLYGPTMKHLETHAYPTTEGLIFNLRDITVRKNAEQELLQAKEKELKNIQKIKFASELASYMKAIDQHALVSVTDSSGKIIQANSKFCEVSGYSQQELLGQDHRLLNSATHPKSFFANLWSTIKQGNTWHGEICNRAKNGNLYWVDSAIVPISGNKGNDDRYISVRIDITERKQQQVEIESAYRALEEANRQLNKLSRIDGLTQIANRRSFDESLSLEVDKLRRTTIPLTLILCDIDFFKNYNDSYGHQKGDVCLQQVAQSIDSSFSRAGDLVARYGGEEFAVILSNIDQQTALMLAERMRSNIENLQLEHTSSAVADRVTLSIGVTSTQLDKNTTVSLLIECADKALYMAKGKGRNRVEFYSPSL